jgi:hypothetical protein
LIFALFSDSYLLKDLWVGVDFVLELSLTRKSTISVTITTMYSLPYVSFVVITGYAITQTLFIYQSEFKRGETGESN